MRTCKRHGRIVHYRISQGKGRYRWSCKRCIGEAVTRRKQRVRRLLVEEAGGRCAVCGYNRCALNFHFHHVNRADKAITMSSQNGRSLATFREEAKKCVLVCANCHGEIEAGLIESPPAGAKFDGRGRARRPRGGARRPS
jgi:hypothetical protein